MNRNLKNKMTTVKLPYRFALTTNKLGLHPDRVTSLPANSPSTKSSLLEFKRGRFPISTIEARPVPSRPTTTMSWGRKRFTSSWTTSRGRSVSSSISSMFLIWGERYSSDEDRLSRRRNENAELKRLRSHRVPLLLL